MRLALRKSRRRVVDSRNVRDNVTWTLCHNAATWFFRFRRKPSRPKQLAELYTLNVLIASS